MITINISVHGPSGSGKTQIMEKLIRVLGSEARVLMREEGQGIDTATLEVGKVEILGYNKEGNPILPIKPGMITTACVISCSLCGAGIRSMGGPSRGAKCVPCYEKEQSDASSNPSSPERP